MKKWIGCLALVLVLAGCGSKQAARESVRILTPQGAPALAVLPFYAEDEVTTVAGSDRLTAELAKTDGEFDLIIAPVNLGAKLIQQGNSDYQLAAVVTWGNLYIVGSKDYKPGDPLAAFGENAVPQKILASRGLEQNVTYFSSVQDVQAQLLSERFTAGLLAEPAVTATMAKAKEKGLDFSIRFDLQETIAGKNGYPQAAVFIKAGREDACADVLTQMEAFLNQPREDQDVLAMIEQAGCENLGIPSGEIALSAWERQNLRYEPAEAVQDELTAFLALFDQ